MKTEIALSVLIAILAFNAEAVKPANDCPTGFKGLARTLVTFTPGPKAAEWQKHIPAHFEFMKRQMKDGKVSYSGPLITDGKPNGKGIAIYTSSKTDQVKAIVETDPMVANKVSKYTMDTWAQCEAE